MPGPGMRARAVALSAASCVDQRHAEVPEGARKRRRPWRSAASGAGRGKAAVTFAARLTLEDVSRRYGESLALDRVSLDIAPSEVLCLLGPSGCGKIDLAQGRRGHRAPDRRGAILLDGQEVAGPERFVPPEKRGIGLMFQDFALFPHLTILDNVAFGLKSLTRSEAKREARAALERVGLAHYAGEYPHILSGGEQQRVALARAIAPRPSVLLMDEPFSGLDSRLREQMREETLAILHETRATAIVVTHDAEEAMRMGDRVALMRQGRIVQTGNALDLYRAPKDILTARTFSELNELAARIEGGNAATAARPLRRQRRCPTAPRPSFACARAACACLRRGRACPARVLDARFLGDVALVEVAVQGLDAPLFARVSESDVPPQGAEVGIVIEPARSWCSPAATAARPAS